MKTFILFFAFFLMILNGAQACDIECSQVAQEGFMDVPLLSFKLKRTTNQNLSFEVEMETSSAWGSWSKVLLVTSRAEQISSNNKWLVLTYSNQNGEQLDLRLRIIRPSRFLKKPVNSLIVDKEILAYVSYAFDVKISDELAVIQRQSNSNLVVTCKVLDNKLKKEIQLR